MKKLFVRVSALAAASLIALAAHAAAPTLSLVREGTSNIVDVKTTADPHAQLSLSYTTSSGSRQNLYLGNADADGYYTTKVDSAMYDIPTGSSVYLFAGNSSLRSAALTWPGAPVSPLSITTTTFTVPVGQTTVVPVYNLGDDTLALAGTTNADIASIALNGSQVSVTGRQNGSTAITVCRTNSRSDCETFTVTVAGSATTQAFSVSETNPVVAVGNSTTVPLNGLITSSLYVSANTNPSAVSASISGGVLTISGGRAGTSVITLCQSSVGCISFTATSIAIATSGSASPVLVPMNESLTVGQAATVLVVGNGGYFISNNNNPDVASASVSGSNIAVTGLAVGTRVVSVCDANQRCTTFNVRVSAAPITPVPAPTPQPPVQPAFQFTSNLSQGSSGVEVTALQGVLKLLGYFSATANGNFGPATEAAVMAFQKAKGISAIGSVGPATRAALNALANGTSPSSPATTPSFTFTSFLTTGSMGNEVLQLQQKLVKLGYLSATPNGYFGPATKAAVIAFQKAHNLSAVGYVGPSTRAALNAN